MSKFTRRNVLRTGIAMAVPPVMVTLINGCEQSRTDEVKRAMTDDKLNVETERVTPIDERMPMKIQYLEIVTPEVDAICLQYATIYDIAFGEPDANLGGARTAKISGGGLIGIRAPLRDTEKPVVRPYLLVEDINSAVASAEKAGAEIAIPPMEIPEHGKFAIVIRGGIECGFWQN